MVVVVVCESIVLAICGDSGWVVGMGDGGMVVVVVMCVVVEYERDLSWW